ncbi:uncharacterized protein LOC106013408 [Aplysia californica]|uniref:Uncharacterized protein LOC106013408 n=1 Tax=Aplysia californica TaxID=6500 RepID=A0ABM1ABH8_APLCA|nr:uncharacterized protein LOC106013408 [Aplysia californica]
MSSTEKTNLESLSSCLATMGPKENEDGDGGDEETSEAATFSSETMVQAQKAKRDQGLYEAEVSFGGEADLHRQIIGCTKNPGHKDFLPFSSLTIDHFPDGYKDEKLLEAVQAWGELVVRIAVDYTSPDRPEFYPDSTDPYPFHQHGGSSMTRYGTGWAAACTKDDGLDVMVFDGDVPCPCEDCEKSGRPATSWGCIVIMTAMHVVFDTSEVERTSVKFFYHDDEDQENTVTLKGKSIKHSDLEMDSDHSEFLAVTHDFEFFEKIRLRSAEANHLIKVAGENYETEETGGLAIVVSHPHGCCKQVTFGRMLERDSLERSERFAYVYSTATCPGSSGGWVWPVGMGVQGRWWYHMAAHSQGLMDRTNMSTGHWIF